MLAVVTCVTNVCLGCMLNGCLQVDKFELVEESPGAPTATKARTRTRPEGEHD